VCRKAVGNRQGGTGRSKPEGEGVKVWNAIRAELNGCSGQEARLQLLPYQPLAFTVPHKISLIISATVMVSAHTNTSSMTTPLRSWGYLDIIQWRRFGTAERP
jgi:hypothetical protein